jgi:hypothetical protein
LLATPGNDPSRTEESRPDVSLLTETFGASWVVPLPISGKKRRLRTGAFSDLAERLQIEIHEKLVRMRAQTQRIVLLHFHVDPVIKEIFVEHVAFEEEIVISFQRFESAQQ